jgi:hypothetical protein
VTLAALRARISVPALLAAWGLFGLGCGGGGSSSAERDGSVVAPTGAISGQVLLSDAGDHLGTLVFCAGTNRVALTDSDGAFTFAELPFGEYQLVAQHDGHMQLSLGEFALSVEAPNATVPTATLERSPPDVVQLPSPARGTLTGRVFLEGSDNHSGAVVTLEGTSIRTVTDAEGRWQVENVEPGDHTLRISAAGHIGAVAHATVRADQQADLLAITLARASGARAVSSDAPRTIMGFVALIGPDGALDADHSQVLVTLEGTGLTIATDAEGYFRFNDLEPGVYRISARAPGHHLTEAAVADLTQQDFYEASLFLESVERPRNDVGAVTGVVELDAGEDLRGVSVGVAGSSLTALTDSAGKFTIEQIPVRPVVIVAQAPGYEVAEVPQVRIVAGETTDLGTLRLRKRQVPPRVIAVDPTDGIQDVLVEPQIPVFVRFSTAMNVDSVREALQVEPRVPHTALMGREHPETDYDLMLILLRGGEGGADHRDRIRVRIGTGARSAEGVAMREPFDSGFRMAGPSLYRSIPVHGESGHPRNAPILLQFNAAMRWEEIDTEVSFTPVPPTIPIFRPFTDPETGWTSVEIQVVLGLNQRYTMRLGRGLRTDTGQRLTGRREIDFRTAPEIVIDHEGMPVERDRSVIY